MEAGPWNLRKGKDRFCSRDCRVKSVTMDRTVASDGYYLVTHNGKRYREHRLVMEQELGRPLTKDESVHHINCDKLDNRPENLYVCDRKHHGEIHANLEKVISAVVKAGVVKFKDGVYELAA